MEVTAPLVIKIYRNKTRIFGGHSQLHHVVVPIGGSLVLVHSEIIARVSGRTGLPEAERDAHVGRRS
jgi:uncharacterized protein GlcG (DUF336 family)